MVWMAAWPARAQDCSTYAGVCENACSASAYQTSCESTVNWIDDIFRDANGNTAQSLTFATYLGGVNDANCPWGQSYPDSGLAYVCNAGPPDAGQVAQAADALDYLWVQNFRSYPDGGGHVCDCEPGYYDPAAGLLFDLGGEANKVVLFPITDHGPLPCESFEYSVYLTDDLQATDVVPPGQPVDRTKWNEAQLYKAFAQGWDPNATADGITTVWQLPCGITFRYASMVAGNHGNPTSACEYDSNEDELDAVAGLNQNDTAICPDKDGDGYAAASCGGTDCDDSDPNVHPGAPENCSSPKDLDCDGKIPACPSGTVCVEGFCGPPCGGGEFGGSCQGGYACLDGGCLPDGCAGGCDAGLVCNGTACVDPCAGAVCPAGQSCRGGGCVDPCDGVVCPPGQSCGGGSCQPSCACAGCPSGEVCLDAGSCVAAACASVSCPAGQLCAAGGSCQSACTGVVCPVGQSCDAGSCGADPCFGVDCGAGERCVAGACVAAGGAGPDAGSAGSGQDGGLPLASDAGPAGDGGTGALAKASCCGCGQGGIGGSWGLLLALAAWASRRKRP